jgi:hypothetical protein
MYNTQFTANLISQQSAQGISDALRAGAEATKQDAMASLAQEQLQGPPKRAGDVSFVRGETLLQPSSAPEKVENPDEIQLDEEEEEDEDGDGGMSVCLSPDSYYKGYREYDRKHSIQPSIQIQTEF